MDANFWSLKRLKNEWCFLANPVRLEYDDDNATVSLQRYQIDHRPWLKPVAPRDFIVCHQNSPAMIWNSVKFGFTAPTAHPITVTGLPNGNIRIRWEGGDIIFSYAESRCETVGEVQMKSLPLVHFLIASDKLKPELWAPMGLLNIHESWWSLLCSEFMKAYFRKLCEVIARERGAVYMPRILPPSRDTFAWTRDLAPLQVKVVILGRRPYMHANKATGIAFSLVPPFWTSKSLYGIYRALNEDEGTRMRNRVHGILSNWTRQGVLLLNDVMTIREGCPASHKSIGWQKLVDAVIDFISQYNRNVAFLLWGYDTWRKGDIVRKHSYDDETRHGKKRPRHFVVCAHLPDANVYCTCPKEHHDTGPYGELIPRHELPKERCNCPKAHQEVDWRSNDYGCESLQFGKHFSQVNRFLDAFGLGAVDWNAPWK